MKRLASRTAQYPLYAEFAVNFNEFVIDSVDGAKKTLGSTVAASTDPLEPALNGPVANTITFDVIPLPVGAVVTGGELLVETAGVGPTAYTVQLGVAGNLAAYLAATSLLATGRTALLLTTPLVSDLAGNNLRATFVYTVANATAGRFRLRVQYTIDGRSQEVQIT